MRDINSRNEIISSVVETLERYGCWMTANEMIAKGHFETKNAPRQAMSHPIYRILTSMMRDSEEMVRGLERRIREEGTDKGQYEYAMWGMYDGTYSMITLPDGTKKKMKKVVKNQ